MSVNPLNKLADAMAEFVAEFSSTPVVGNLEAGVTQYSFWMICATLILLVVLAVFIKRQKQDIVPRGLFVNMMESVVEFARDDLCKQVLGPTWRKHFPFIATVFFFILFNNLSGVIPGARPGTGSIGATAAVALVSFIYFIVVGIQVHGAGGYLKSFAPAGVSGILKALVWVIELFSTLLRLVSLSVRLFCNLFAGHIVLGTFAILTSLFIEPLFQQITPASLGLSAASLGWILILIAIYAVELLVAVIQAYVFALLSAVYIQLAEEHH